MEDGMSDTHAYEAFLGELRALTDAPGSDQFNRQNVVALLGVIAQHLGMALATPSGALEDGTQVFVEHPAAALLVMLISALRDLDSGLTGEVIKPNTHGANATRPWHVREQDRVLIEALAIVQRQYGINNRKLAAKKLAVMLKGQLRKGVQIDYKQIISIHNRYKD